MIDANWQLTGCVQVCVPHRVAERVELCYGDARQLPIDSQAFDVVVSSLALHNIPGAGERAAAVGEIVRVLKPGAHLAILDFRHTGQYAAVLAAAGLGDVHRSQRRVGMYPPVRVVTATQGIALRRRTRTYFHDGAISLVWVPESRSWVLSCGFVEEAIGPR